MFEMMIDLETLDTRSSAIVLSVGAVVWETMVDGNGDLSYEIAERFLRRFEIDTQVAAGRTVSESTLLWWHSDKVSADARAEAFGSRDRYHTGRVLQELRMLAAGYVVDHKMNHFWASPATFDFPIIESLAEGFGIGETLPWSYRQKYDVRTVVNEAGYSAGNHVAQPGLSGVPHAPVYDCEWQIDLLTAARNKTQRRIKSS